MVAGLLGFFLGSGERNLLYSVLFVSFIGGLLSYVFNAGITLPYILPSWLVPFLPMSLCMALAFSVGGLGGWLIGWFTRDPGAKPMSFDKVLNPKVRVT
jgi:membrane protein YqaA with SNARE-associated domain